MCSSKYIFAFVSLVSMLEGGSAQQAPIRPAALDMRSRRLQNSYLISRVRELEDEKNRDKVTALMNNYMIQYELALTYIEKRDHTRIEKHLENAITLQPDFALPHNLLGRLEYKKNRTPAFMALCFYNLLTPQAEESRDNLLYLKELLSRIVLTTPHSADLPNDFSSVDLSLNAKNTINSSFSNGRPDYFLMRFNWLCRALIENSAHQAGFFWNFYAPYFIDVYKLGYAQAAVWILFDKPAKNPELANRISEFKAWNKNYILKRFYYIAD